MEFLESCDNTDFHCQSEVKSDEYKTRKVHPSEPESYPDLDSGSVTSATTPSKPRELLQST